GRASRALAPYTPLSRSQPALAEQHGSQRGFCTPGIVVSLAAGQLAGETDHDRQLSGNLCRCTGYAPIVRAAKVAARQPVPDWLRSEEHTSELQSREKLV